MAIFRILGLLLLCVGSGTLFPLGLAVADGDSMRLPFSCTFVLTAAVGAVLLLLPRDSGETQITHKQSLVAVGLCWIAACLSGALPYFLSGTLGWTDAVFETVSGFTTTGATVLTDIERLPRSLLLWRSLTHWIGGMGIIMLSLALLPLLGVGGMQLYKAEVTGPKPDRLTPRLQDTSKLLWTVYLLLTVTQSLLLMLAGMDWFDAVNHAFATVATGGFSTRNASLAAFPSPWIQWITIIFMAAAGVNFALHLRALSGKWSAYARSTEFLVYMKLLGMSTLLITLALIFSRTFPLHNPGDFEAVLRAAAFQVVSICTTTGFITEDYSLWPTVTLFILLFCGLIGGCAGSTAGGFKVLRYVIADRYTKLEIARFLHPRAVKRLKLDGKSLESDVIQGVLGFLLLYLGILLFGTFLLCAFNLDLITAFTGVWACLSNVGPGLGALGPVDNFSHLPVSVKWVLSLCMLLGRLEIYAIIVLFLPEFWKK